MEAYCNRMGLNSQSIRFLYDRQCLQEGQTPKDVNMEDGDVIGMNEPSSYCINLYADVVLQQTGGYFAVIK